MIKRIMGKIWEILERIIGKISSIIGAGLAPTDNDPATVFLFSH